MLLYILIYCVPYVKDILGFWYSYQINIMLHCFCFTTWEDRATLRSDPSALVGLYGRRCCEAAPFLIYRPNTVFRETKAVNLGVWGRAPLSKVRVADTLIRFPFCFWYRKRVCPGDEIIMILFR